MLETARDLLHRVLYSDFGDSFLLIRLEKRILRSVNEMLGRPLAPRAGDTPAAPPPVAREPAPVMVYFERDRNVRELTRVQDTLRARNISYKLLDVSGDPSTKSFVVQTAQCEEDDLPVVFVAGTVVGCYNELVQWDVSGRLTRDVFGA